MSACSDEYQSIPRPSWLSVVLSRSRCSARRPSLHVRRRRHLDQEPAVITSTRGADQRLRRRRRASGRVEGAAGRVLGDQTRRGTDVIRTTADESVEIQKWRPWPVALILLLSCLLPVTASGHHTAERDVRATLYTVKGRVDCLRRIPAVGHVQWKERDGLTQLDYRRGSGPSSPYGPEPYLEGFNTALRGWIGASFKLGNVYRPISAAIHASPRAAIRLATRMRRADEGWRVHRIPAFRYYQNSNAVIAVNDAYGMSQKLRRSLHVCFPGRWRTIGLS